jgi:hypothetical protein
MSYLDDSSLDGASWVAASNSREARSRRLHEDFEAYYAERERRRLNEEARARRTAARRSDDHALEQLRPDR